MTWIRDNWRPSLCSNTSHLLRGCLLFISLNPNGNCYSVTPISFRIGYVEMVFQSFRRLFQLVSVNWNIYLWKYQRSMPCPLRDIKRTITFLRVELLPRFSLCKHNITPYLCRCFYRFHLVWGDLSIPVNLAVYEQRTKQYLDNVLFVLFIYPKICPLE